MAITNSINNESQVFTSATTLTATAGNVIITAGNLTLPATNGAFSQGTIRLAGSPFIHGLGTRNIFGGLNAGILLSGGTDNVGIGANSLNVITSGVGNTAIGSYSLDALSTASNNTAIGYNALIQATGSTNTALGSNSLIALVGGVRNIGIGYAVGTNYTGNESDNVLISSLGVVGESNKIRIGTTGTGSFQQDTCYLAGTVIADTAFKTSSATANLSIAGTTITSGGSNGTVGLSIVAKGGADINITTQTGGSIVFRGVTSGFTSSEWHTNQASVQTLNATPTNIISIVVADSEMVSIIALVNGFQGDFTDCIGGQIMVTAYRSSGGDVTLVGAPIINVNYTDTVNTSDVDASVDIPTQTVRIQVVGVTAQTWNWVASYNYMYTISNA